MDEQETDQTSDAHDFLKRNRTCDAASSCVDIREFLYDGEGNYAELWHAGSKSNK